jgi:hypothetical protein
MNAFRLLAAAVGISLSLASNAWATDPITVSDRAVILAPEQAPRLMKPCSRPGPDKVSGFWMPAASDVALMEKELPAFMKKSGFKHPVSDYCRQYVGVIANGRKIIYINAVPVSDAEDKEVDPEDRMQWKKEPAIVCDGGPEFWGVEFDLVAKEFLHFEGNGAI